MKTVRRLSSELEEVRSRLDECRQAGDTGTPRFYELHRSAFELQRDLMKQQDPELYARLYADHD